MGTSWFSAAPASGPRMKDPSPKRVSSRPSPLKRWRALRTVTRLTPNWAASSFSEGSLSPGFQPPERICSRSWSNTCWLTLLLTTFLMDIVGRSFDKMVVLIVTSGAEIYNSSSAAKRCAGDGTFLQRFFFGRGLGRRSAGCGDLVADGGRRQRAAQDDGAAHPEHHHLVADDGGGHGRKVDCGEGQVGKGHIVAGHRADGAAQDDDRQHDGDADREGPQQPQGGRQAKGARVEPQRRDQSQRAARKDGGDIFHISPEGEEKDGDEVQRPACDPQRDGGHVDDEDPDQHAGGDDDLMADRKSVV